MFGGFLAQRSVLCSPSCAEEPLLAPILPSSSAEFPEGTHPAGDLGSWIQRSRESSVIRGNLSIVFTQFGRNGSDTSQSCQQQHPSLRSWKP